MINPIPAGGGSTWPLTFFLENIYIYIQWKPENSGIGRRLLDSISDFK